MPEPSQGAKAEMIAEAERGIAGERQLMPESHIYHRELMRACDW